MKKKRAKPYARILYLVALSNSPSIIHHIIPFYDLVVCCFDTVFWDFCPGHDISQGLLIVVLLVNNDGLEPPATKK